MLTFKIENTKAILAKVLTKMNFSLLNGQEVEIKPSIFVKLVGKMDFHVEAKNNGIELSFKIAPQIRVDKFFQVYGDLTSIFVHDNFIEFRIDGLPDVTLEAVS